MYTPVYGNSALHRHSKDTLLPLRQGKGQVSSFEEIIYWFFYTKYTTDVILHLKQVDQIPESAAYSSGWWMQTIRNQWAKGVL